MQWYVTGAKKQYGGLPVAERSDGTFMNETQPLARYIARHNGYYPSDPIEAWYSDYYTNMYEPIINGTFKYLVLIGSA